MVMDDQSNLHLAWLETGGFRRYLVTYASTAAEVMESYNVLTLRDAVDSVLSGSMDFLARSVLTLVPVLFAWAVVPMIGLAVYHGVSGEERLELWHSWVILAAAALLQVGLAMVYPPSQAADWPPLRWVAPLVSAGVAVVVTVLVLRRREESRLFGAFFLFTGVHSLLEMLIYFLA